MKIAKSIVGAIDFILILLLLIFSFGGQMIVASTALGVLTIVFSVIALISICAHIALTFVKNEKMGKFGKITGIVAGVSSIAAGGVGLPYAIVATVKSGRIEYDGINQGLSITNIPISGNIILFSLIFIALVLLGLSSNKKGSKVQLHNSQVKMKEEPANIEIHELDRSREILKTVPISATSNIGVGLWTSICISLCGIFGLKSMNYNKKMNRVMEDALKELILQSYYMDADTVIDIHYALSGLAVIVSGTAVFYKK